MAAEGSVTQTKKADPNVQVPAAVKAAGERADELAKQVAEAKKNNPTGDALVQVAPQQAPANPGVTMERFDPSNPQSPPDPTLSSTQSKRQSEQATSVTQQPQELQDWEHQFKSIKGRYDRAEQDNKRMAGQINDMQRLIMSISNAQNTQTEGSGVRFSGQAAGANGRPFPQGVKRITEKDISDYGSDLIDVVGRRAMEVQDATLTPELYALRGELNALKQQMHQTTAYDAQTRMYSQLDKEIPNWKEINSHPEFVRWLQVPDPLSGQIRHNMLGEAYNSQQATRVLEFFRRFLSDQASYGPASNGQSPGNGSLTASSYGTTPQVDLMSLAAPGRAKTGQSQFSPEKPSFTVAEIKQFYTDSANGRYAGRETEYNRLQQEIFAAGREGRVRS